MGFFSGLSPLGLFSRFYGIRKYYNTFLYIFFSKCNLLSKFSSLVYAKVVLVKFVTLYVFFHVLHQKTTTSVCIAPENIDKGQSVRFLGFQLQIASVSKLRGLTDGQTSLMHCTRICFAVVIVSFQAAKTYC